MEAARPLNRNLRSKMKSAHEQREELARLTRYANQLAADLADTRARIRLLVADLGLPRITVFRPLRVVPQPQALKFGPSFDVLETLPETWKSVRLQLPDGSTPLGVWTGFEWWSQGRLQQPTHWQPILPELQVQAAAS